MFFRLFKYVSVGLLDRSIDPSRSLVVRIISRRCIRIDKSSVFVVVLFSKKSVTVAGHYEGIVSAVSKTPII